MTGYDPAPLLARWPDTPDRTVAEYLDVSHRTIQRWRNGHTRIGPYHADQLACRNLRCHPTELWPDWGNT